MKTTITKIDNSSREWLVVDVKNRPLGRAAVAIANLLRGRGKPIFAPQVDTGDFVVVINAEKIKLTGKKNIQKVYQRYSGFRSGLRKIPAFKMRQQHPDRMIKQAVLRMLPKNNLSRDVFRRLKVYAGEAHPHAAQAPRTVELN